jgi:dTDP-4-dehydrorhamnose reductase
MDITDQEAVTHYVKNAKLDEVIHSAALTGITRCEEDKERAYLTNVEGTRNLVRAVAEYHQDCLFVYISTASVFYGDRGGYRESDVPYPRNFYSLTKLLGEFVVSESTLKNQLIIRTNFVGRKKWPYAKAFTDRFATYLFADDLASATRHVIDQGLRGLAHVYGKEKLSMFELAKITTPEVEPIDMSEYSGPPVPIDMSLRSDRIPPFELTRSKNQ